MFLYPYWKVQSRPRFFMVLVVEEQRWKGEGNNEKNSERTEADLFYITIGILIHKDLGIFFWK